MRKDLQKDHFFKIVFHLFVLMLISNFVYKSLENSRER